MGTSIHMHPTVGRYPLIKKFFQIKIERITAVLSDAVKGILCGLMGLMCTPKSYAVSAKLIFV